MTTEIDPQSESSESRKRLRVLSTVLATGVVIGFSAAIADARNPSGFVPTALGFVELLVCLFVVGTAVEMARERSPGKLLEVGLVLTATPFVPAALVVSFASGGHDAAMFGLVYRMRASVASGLSLSVVAGVRFVIEQRKRQSSANE
jgi:hypothetical protein